MATRTLSFNQDVKALVPRAGLLPEFLVFSLQARKSQILDLVSSAGSGTGVLDTGPLKRLPIWIPNLKEQHAIVELLSDAEKSIEMLDYLIAKKMAMKQGVLQQLVSGAGVSTARMNDAGREFHLGQLLRRPPRYGINAAASPLTPGVPAYIRITDIDGHGKFSPSPKVGVIHPASLDYLLGDGELVFARTGASVGKTYLYDPCDGELVYAGFLINVAPDPQVLSPKYLFLFTQTKAYWNWVARTSVRSGQPGINGREYAQLPISVPDIEMQRAITEIVGDVDSEIDALVQRLAKAKMVKVGMMQELLTGRTRLPIQEGEA